MTWSDIFICHLFSRRFQRRCDKLRHTHLAHWTHKYTSNCETQRNCLRIERTTCAIRISDKRRISTAIIKWAIRREEIAHQAEMRTIGRCSITLCICLIFTFSPFYYVNEHFCGLPQRFLLPDDQCNGAKTKTEKKIKLQIISCCVWKSFDEIKYRHIKSDKSSRNGIFVLDEIQVRAHWTYLGKWYEINCCWYEIFWMISIFKTEISVFLMKMTLFFCSTTDFITKIIPLKKKKVLYENLHRKKTHLFLDFPTFNWNCVQKDTNFS